MLLASVLSDFCDGAHGEALSLALVGHEGVEESQSTEEDLATFRPHLQACYVYQ